MPLSFQNKAGPQCRKRPCVGLCWPCFPSCRQCPLPERFSPLSVSGRLQRREIPRMSGAPPSVPRSGSDFGLVRGETGASERFPASPRFSLGPPGAVSRISEARFSVQTGPILHPRPSEDNRGLPRSERFPVYGKGPQKNAHSQNAHARVHVLTPPCTQRHTKCTRKVVCQNKPVVRSTRGAHAEHTRRTRNPPVW